MNPYLPLAEHLFNDPDFILDSVCNWSKRKLKTHNMNAPKYNSRTVDNDEYEADLYEREEEVNLYEEYPFPNDPEPPLENIELWD